MKGHFSKNPNLPKPGVIEFKQSSFFPFAKDGKRPCLTLDKQGMDAMLEQLMRRSP